MKFEFSEEQEMLRDQCQKVLGDLCPLDTVAKALETTDFRHRELWDEISSLGWPAVAIPESYGGLGMGYLELCVIAEELGRSLAPIPFSSSIYLAAPVILEAGTEDQKSEWLPKIASGETVATLAIEDSARVANGSPGLSAASDGTLSGTVPLLRDAQAADVAIVTATDTQQTLALYIVELNNNSSTLSPLVVIDPTQPYASVHLDKAPAARIAGSGNADESLLAVKQIAAVLFAFEQVGGAQAALDMAVAYAKDRFAFGQPIGSFQAIKHKLADCYCELEIARSNALFAAWALSTNAEELEVAAATARLSANKAFETCSRESLQVHGGIGFTWEASCHLYLRRSRQLALTLGGDLEWRERLMNALKRNFVSQTGTTVTEELEEVVSL